MLLIAPKSVPPRSAESQITAFVSPPPSLHFIMRSRSFQPSPVEGVPPRSPNLDYACHSESAGVRPNAGTKVALLANSKTSMSYITDFETEFTKKLLSSEKSETLVRWVCEKLLESYRNGITAGQNGTTVKRPGESRRRGSYGKAE